jgi:hypothetical protein
VFRLARLRDTLGVPSPGDPALLRESGSSEAIGGDAEGSSSDLLSVELHNYGAIVLAGEKCGEVGGSELCYCLVKSELTV